MYERTNQVNINSSIIVKEVCLSLRIPMGNDFFISTGFCLPLFHNLGCALSNWQHISGVSLEVVIFWHTYKFAISYKVWLECFLVLNPSSINTQAV